MGKNQSDTTGLPPSAGLHGYLARLPGMQATMQRIRDLASVEFPVLIEGEPGTAVEFVARETHRRSTRGHRPFIVVPCSGESESAFTRRLWGTAQETFPETPDEPPGLLDSVDGGTLLFEEARDIPISIQIRLARLLKANEAPSTAHGRGQQVNVRFIFATRFDLVQEVAEGRFHPDLLYKIRIAQIRIPPLRERREDIPLLATFHLRNINIAADRQQQSIGDEAMQYLLDYSWPGNMAELQSAIEYASLRCRASEISAEDLPSEVLSPRTTASRDTRRQQEKERFLAAIQTAKGNRTQAARLLGISRATLYRRLKELGIGRRE